MNLGIDRLDKIAINSSVGVMIAAFSHAPEKIPLMLDLTNLISIDVAPSFIIDLTQFIKGFAGDAAPFLPIQDFSNMVNISVGDAELINFSNTLNNLSVTIGII